MLRRNAALLLLVFVATTFMILTLPRPRHDPRPPADIVKEAQGRHDQRMPKDTDHQEEDEKAKKEEEERPEKENGNHKEDEKKKKTDEHKENKKENKDKKKQEEEDKKEDKAKIPSIKERVEEQYRGPKGGLRERLADMSLVISPERHGAPPKA